MFTSMHGLIPKWFYLGCLLIQGTGNLTLPIEHPKFWTWFQQIVGVIVPTKMNPADIACRGLSPKRTSHMCSMVGRPSMAFLYRATTSKQLMGDLPTHRVTPSRPFSVCGVDYAGPINILRYRGRGAKTTKGYIALFVCFVTKALHLELVSDLTPEAFIVASLKRFCARRGAPKHIYCDNGTTFVGARRKFTLLTQVEAILNSRPLVSLDCDNDPDSLNILTPSHFLIGEVITSSPEHTNDDKLSLAPVGILSKNEVGEIVIIKEDNIPPATWPLGKVIETHPGIVLRRGRVQSNGWSLVLHVQRRKADCERWQSKLPLPQNNIIPSHFQLFPDLKVTFSRRNFQNNAEVEQAMQSSQTTGF
ncbi:integrase catalytic domain-containing protein [Trichonephila clavipes]|nr:integrase catalytic domain-containing protein [Trichonephila clavipes]